MKIGELLDAAKRARGTFGALADEMGCHQNRFAEWRKGTRRPDAGEIIQLAEIAGMPAFQTLAQIESELDEKHSAAWRKALGKLTAAGLAATVAAVIVMSPQNANASPSQVSALAPDCILCQLRRRLSEWLASSVRRLWPIHRPC